MIPDLLASHSKFITAILTGAEMFTLHTRTLQSARAVVLTCSPESGSCRSFRNNAARLQIHALANNTRSMHHDLAIGRPQKKNYYNAVQFG